MKTDNEKMGMRHSRASLRSPPSLAATWVLALASTLMAAPAAAQVESYRLLRITDTVVSNTDPNLADVDDIDDWENSLGVNPSSPDEIVVLGFSGNWSGTDRGPLWHSLDGGRSWTKRFTIPAPPGILLVNDQTLDWGRNDQLNITFLTISPGFNVVSVATTDPADPGAFNYLINGGGAVQLTNAGAPGSIGNADQPWLIVNRDPFLAEQDNVYVGYDDFNNSDGIDGPDLRVAVSYGSNPLDFVVDTQVGNSVGFVNPGLRLVKSSGDGTIYALFGRCPGANCTSSDDPKTVDYMLNRSVDGGLSWSLDGDPFGTIIATAQSTQILPKFGTVNSERGGAHQAAVDPATGVLYYTYQSQDAAGNDRLALVTVTVDATGNTTVGPERFLSLADSALAQLAVDDTGTLAALYYTFDGFSSTPPNRPLFSAHLALTADAGVNVLDQVLVTFESPELTDGDSRQRVLGDYQQIKPLGSCFYGTFTANGAAFGRSIDDTDPIFFKVCRPADACLLASERLDIRDRSQVVAPVAAGLSLRLGADADSIGDATVDGDAFLADRALVEGDLTLSGTLSHQNTFTITGVLTENAGDVLIPSLERRTFPVGSGFPVVNNDANVTLNPANRGNMTFRARANVTLNPGVYNFASLNIEPDVTVFANGPVEINVQGQLMIGDRSTLLAGAADDLVLYTNAPELRIGTDVTLNGIVLGPDANINVYSRTDIDGCIGGKNVTLEPDVVVDGAGLSLPVAAAAP